MLSNLVLAGLLVLPPALGSEYEKAGHYAAKAFFKQAKLDKMAKRIEKRVVPKEWREPGAFVITVGRVLVERQIVYEVTF